MSPRLRGLDQLDQDRTVCERACTFVSAAQGVFASLLIRPVCLPAFEGHADVRLPDRETWKQAKATRRFRALASALILNLFRVNKTAFFAVTK